ncbi:bacteriocin class II family protein [Streptococcus pluranimalium]|uniref:bacteriocin class II family protein n=1 Tax=Streptococcus pluranimalium TaxID=82348 RepID=UPI003F68E36A
MNTKTMEQFEVMDEMVLSTIEGGDGGASLLWFLVGGVYSYYANEATASCRKNPKQWHCVNIK